MKSLKVALINQTNGGAVPAATLAALRQQVDNHLAPAWNVRADISVLDAGDVIPPDTLPLNIVDSLTGRAGVHSNFQGQPSAEVVNDDQLSITLSHELLEMLVDPSGTTVKQAADLDPYSGGQQVNYLVEVCDPCAVYSYDIDGVPVSDFVLPSFYDPTATGPVDFLRTLAEPLPQAVPQGCYISWLDPQDGKWHQQRPDGTFVTADATTGRNPRADRDSAFGDADENRHNMAAIYRNWVS